MTAGTANRALRVAAAMAADLEQFASPPPSEGRSPAVRDAHTDGAVLDAYDALIDDAELRTTTRSLFRDGHWAQSVEEAFKYLNNLVKQRTGLAADGADLMRRALSPKDPILKLSALKTASQKDQQLGYMDIMAGAMTGVRNPRAHEHRYLEDPRVALQLICLANHLARSVRQSTRSRRRRPRGNGVPS